jgi:protein-tyrosine phosphatase
VAKPGEIEDMAEPTRILFVCMGNICRSPLAESVFRHLARERGVEDRFELDSAGTSGYHVGAAPDRRSAATALGRGVEVTGRSRQLAAVDLRRFDYVIAMDADNLQEIEALHAAAGGTARVHRLREWDPEGGGLDVPDPYYGGARGFEDVHDMVERSCAALLDHLLREQGTA